MHGSMPDHEKLRDLTARQAPRFIGLHRLDAERLAAQLGLEITIIAGDTYDWDLRGKRINIELDDQSIVIKAWAG